MFDFSMKEFLKLHSESIDPCESFVFTDDEDEALLDSDDEIELLLVDGLSVLFPSVCFFDIVSATL